MGGSRRWRPLVDLGFYATMAHTRASPIVPRGAGDNSELELNMLPGGEAHVKVEDIDTGEPLTARLIVHGVAAHRRSQLRS